MRLFDTAGKPVLSSREEPLKSGNTRRSGRFSSQPCSDTNQVDGSSNADMLQSRLLQPNITRTSQIESTHSLRDSGFNALSFSILHGELLGMLSLTCRMPRLVLLLRTDTQQPAGILRFRVRTQRKTRTLLTISRREADLDHLMLTTILRRGSTDTGLPFWANSLLMVPINLKLTIVNPLRCVRLPLNVDFSRSNQLNSKRLLARGKQMSRDVS